CQRRRRNVVAHAFAIAFAVGFPDANGQSVAQPHRFAHGFAVAGEFTDTIIDAIDIADVVSITDAAANDDAAGKSAGVRDKLISC
ncbi:MAG TPA: hypothetical protein PK988_04950, partial [Candidatus Sumerlaeota bacterium]|nr:hypothetical protein [Candidatus Sumerlaeota bacterium]